MTRDEILKTAKPIILTVEDVQAVRDCRKTMLRIVMRKPPADEPSARFRKLDADKAIFAWKNSDNLCERKTPYLIGDYLYVRESWRYANDLDGAACVIEETGKYIYAADYTEPFNCCNNADGIVNEKTQWKPAVFMPKEAARIFLRVSDIRAERLQDITVEDCVAEGIDVEVPSICRLSTPTAQQQQVYDSMTVQQRDRYVQELARHKYMGWCTYADKVRIAYCKRWNKRKIHANLDKCSWDADPWVWVIIFEYVKI